MPKRDPASSAPQSASPTDDSDGFRKGLTSYGDRDFSLFLRKAFIKGAGYSDQALDRPVVGIANTGSAFNPCHGNAPQLLEAVKRGVMLAGGLPMDFPTISIHESFAYPTSMYMRNLMSIDTEEMIRAQPMDAVVLIGGCDKTVPAQLMGAASAGIPTVQLVTGSMLTGSHRSERVGACTDCRRYWGRYRAEEIDAQEIADVNNQLVASVGTCSVMGTASTMACIAEALGMTVPGGASPPATTADRIRIAELSGTTAVQIARDRLTIDKVLTPAAFENAMRVLLAIGGSTNGIVHLTAIAGRMGFDIDLQGARPHGPRNAGPGGSEALRPALYGGLPPRRRNADAAARAEAAAAPRRADGDRPHARRGDRARRAGLRAGCGASAREPDLSAGRHCRAAGQSRAGRRDHQAVGGVGRANGARRKSRGVRERRRIWRTASTTLRSTSRRTTSWC